MRRGGQSHRGGAEGRPRPVERGARGGGCQGAVARTGPARNPPGPKSPPALTGPAEPPLPGVPQPAPLRIAPHRREGTCPRPPPAALWRRLRPPAPPPLCDTAPPRGHTTTPPPTLRPGAGTPTAPPWLHRAGCGEPHRHPPGSPLPTAHTCHERGGAQPRGLRAAGGHSTAPPTPAPPRLGGTVGACHGAGVPPSPPPTPRIA